MEIIEKLQNGNEITYRIVNGTAYHKQTPQKIVDILENARNKDLRVRLFYGCTNTGIDWKEELDIIGYIGRSTGRIKIPLLIKNSRSLGGGAILDHCIVKITIHKQIVYQHPKYQLGNLTVKDGVLDDYPFAVLCDHDNIANFRSRKRAENYASFLKGERNTVN